MFRKQLMTDLAPPFVTDLGVAFFVPVRLLLVRLPCIKK